MDKRDIVERVSKLLREREAKKYIKPRPTFLKVTSESGESAKFRVMMPATTAVYTKEDVSQFLETFFEVIDEAIRNNDPIHLMNECRISLEVVKGKYLIHPKTGERMYVPDKYRVKFRPGKNIIDSINAATARELGERDISIDDIDYSDDISEADEIFNNIDSEDAE